MENSLDISYTDAASNSLTEKTTGRSDVITNEDEQGKQVDTIHRKMQKLLTESKNLWTARQRFDEQMGASAARRERLTEDLEYFQERKNKCQKIIKENDAKRWRALQTFCGDNAFVSIRKREKHTLNAEFKKARQNYVHLLNKASELRKYETYLLDVISYLPRDYIKLADNAIAGLIMRYNTLHETNENLRKAMEVKSEEVRKAQAELKQLIEGHRTLIFEKNSQLSELYTRREKMNDLLQGSEQAMVHSHEDVAQQLSNFKTILRSINNLTSKLIRAYEPSLPTQQLLGKVHAMPLLSRCQFIKERSLSIRDIISQLAADTGTLPVSRYCRPDLDTGRGSGSGVLPIGAFGEFTELSKVTSGHSDSQA